jgi:photosynthetic reaction center H subunit
MRESLRSDDELGARAPGRLRRLDDLDDFKVADGEPDIRGWDVIASDGEEIGEVHDLIVDMNAMKVRYLDIEVDKDVLGAKHERHILLPIGFATIDDDRNDVRITTIASTQLLTIPIYEHGDITREYEEALRNSYPQVGARQLADMPRTTTHLADTTRTAAPLADANLADVRASSVRTSDPRTSDVRASEARLADAPLASGPVDDIHERRLADTPPMRADGVTTDYYGSPEFDDNQFWGNRRRGRETVSYVIRY